MVFEVSMTLIKFHRILLVNFEPTVRTTSARTGLNKLYLMIYTTINNICNII